MLETYRATMEQNGELEARRGTQAARAVREHAWARLLEIVEQTEAADELVATLAADAAAERIAASQAGIAIVEQIVESGAPGGRGKALGKSGLA